LARLVSPFSKAEATAAQTRCCETLGTPLQVVNSIGMKLVFVPPGQFQMGSPADSYSRDGDERIHVANIHVAFYLGVYEVTQEQYEQVMGRNPSVFSENGDRGSALNGEPSRQFPVDSISWEDAAKFCRQLSQIPDEQGLGRRYRLPTEAEWEYACRAGTTTAFHVGSALTGRSANCNEGWTDENEENILPLGRTATVGSYAPNAFGLYDMHGNVMEWCHDWYVGDYFDKSPPYAPQGPSLAASRVLRGGCWAHGAGDCRSADRLRNSPQMRSLYVGFRVVMVPSSFPG
jgi:formylglycine-generating enzyme required for sulfatase activity